MNENVFEISKKTLFEDKGPFSIDKRSGEGEQKKAGNFLPLNKKVILCLLIPFFICLIFSALTI